VGISPHAALRAAPVFRYMAQNYRFCQERAAFMIRIAIAPAACAAIAATLARRSERSLLSRSAPRMAECISGKCAAG
jgi:hypothetical protein